MSGGAAPLASISLRDGTWLQIAVDGVRNKDRVIELAKIQDARQVSPNPETIAFRVAGMGLLEFEPEHVGDGAIALEALFQLRPDLRPVGFGLPADSFPATEYAGYPVLPSYGTAGTTPNSAAGFPPGYAQPSAFPSSPGLGYAEAEAMARRRARGLLTPVPRGFGETVAAILQLYGSKLRVWLLLGLGIAPIAGMLDGGVSYLIFSRIVQGNQPSSIPSPTSCVLPTYQFETGGSLVRDGVSMGVLLLLSLVVTAFQTAVLGIGARDAVLDRQVSVKRSFRSALQRWRPTLGASFLAGAAYYLVLLPAAVSYVILYVTASGSNLCETSGTTNTVLALGCLGSLFLVVGLVLAALLAVRLGFAPYIAATSNVGVRQAIARSWQITQGHFWRAFGIILLTGTPVWLMLQVVSAFPPLVMVFVLTPITYLFTVPLIALTYITLLYDLLLRYEGYAAVTQEQPALPSTPPAPVPPLG